LGWGRAFVEHEGRLPGVLLDHAVADEAIAYARYHPGLADRPGKPHHRGEDVLRRLLATHDLEQLHDVRRREEVHADDILGTTGEPGDPVDIEGRGVRREDRAFLHELVERLEHHAL